MANPSRGHKDRKRNFSTLEADAVADYVIEHHDELFGLRGRHATPAQREAHWRELADAVTALGQEVRTTSEVRRRWQDEKQRVKRLASREADMRALVGPGACGDTMSARDRRILPVLDAALIVGLGECDTELPPSGAGSSALESQPSTSGVATADSRAVVAETSSEDDETLVPSQDLPMGCMFGGQPVRAGQPGRRTLQSLLYPSSEVPSGGAVLVEDTPLLAGHAEEDVAPGFVGDACRVSPVLAMGRICPATPPPPPSPEAVPAADPGRRRGPRGRRAEDMERFEGWTAEFTRQQNTHQASIGAIGATLTGMAGTMVDMHLEIADFHRAALDSLAQMNGHLAYLIGAHVEHIGGPVVAPSLPVSPQIRAPPPATPSPPWPTCPEYLSLLRSVMAGPPAGSGGERLLNPRPSCNVPSEPQLSAAALGVAMDVEAQLRYLRGGVRRLDTPRDPVVAGSGGCLHVPMAGAQASGSGTRPGSEGVLRAAVLGDVAMGISLPVSGVRHGRFAGQYSESGTLTATDASSDTAGQSAGSRTVTGSEGGWRAAGLAAGVRARSMPVRGGRYGRLAELSSGSETMTVSGSSRTHARAGVLSTGSDTMTLSEVSLRTARRACLSSGSETLPLSVDSRRPPSSDED